LLIFFVQLAEAKELYKTTHNHAFNLDHCWGILKDAPKWQASQAEFELKSKKNKEPKPSKTPNKTSSIPPTNETQPSSPQASGQANEETEQEEQSVLGSNGRPVGQKSTKRKRNDDDVVERMLKAQEVLMKLSQRRMNSVEKAMQIAAND
jgi:hypothetical protein